MSTTCATTETRTGNDDNADCAAVAGRWFVCLMRGWTSAIGASKELFDSHNELDWCLTDKRQLEVQNDYLGDDG